MTCYLSYSNHQNSKFNLKICRFFCKFPTYIAKFQKKTITGNVSKWMIIIA